jgi:hypothetical protein
MPRGFRCHAGQRLLAMFDSGREALNGSFSIPTDSCFFIFFFYFFIDSNLAHRR